MPKNTLRFISIYFRSVYYTMEAEFKNIIALLKKNKETKPVKTVIQKVTDVNSNVYDDNEDTQILEKNLEQKSKTKSENNFKQFPKPEEVPSENDDNDNVVAAAKAPAEKTIADADEEAAEAKRKADEEAKRKADEEAKRKADEEAEKKRKAEEAAEAKRKTDEEAKRKADEEGKVAAYAVTSLGNLNNFKDTILSKLKEIQTAAINGTNDGNLTTNDEKLTENNYNNFTRILTDYLNKIKNPEEVKVVADVVTFPGNLNQFKDTILLKLKKIQIPQINKKIDGNLTTNDTKYTENNYNKFTRILTDHLNKIKKPEERDSETQNKELTPIEKNADEHNILNDLVEKQTKILDEQTKQTAIISTITSQMTDIQNKINELDKIQNDSSNKELLQKTVEELKKEEQTRHTETVKKISHLTEELKTHITSLEDKINTINNIMINSLEEKIENPAKKNDEPNNQKTLIEQIKQTLEDVNKKLTEDLGNYTQSINAINEKIDEKLTQIDKKITTIDTKLTTIDTKLTENNYDKFTRILTDHLNKIKKPEKEAENIIENNQYMIKDNSIEKNITAHIELLKTEIKNSNNNIQKQLEEYKKCCEEFVKKISIPPINRVDEFNKKIQESLQLFFIRDEFKNKAIEQIQKKISSILNERNANTPIANTPIANEPTVDGEITPGSDKVISSF